MRIIRRTCRIVVLVLCGCGSDKNAGKKNSVNSQGLTAGKSNRIAKRLLSPLSVVTAGAKSTGALRSIWLND